MAIFISYSHNDAKFVDTLAAHLVKNNTHVWVDRWELTIGDSIIQKVQDAIQESSALLVVLSKSSVQSEWCKQELTSGLLKQLENKKVFVLPVLLEDCEIPLFLQDKLYADFRTNFDDGLNAVLEGVAKYSTADVRGRFEKNGNFLTDWAQDWGEENGLRFLRLTFVDHSEKLPFSILSTVKIRFNADDTRRFKQYCDNDLEWYGRMIFLLAISEGMLTEEWKLILEDTLPKFLHIKTKGKNDNVNFDIEIESRWLGQDHGKDLLLDIGLYFNIVTNSIKDVTRRPTKEESIKIEKIKHSRI